MSAAPATQRFLYKAMGAGAGVTQGEIESTDGSRAREELRRQGLVVIELRSASGRVERSGRAAAGAGKSGGGGRARRDGAWQRTRAEVFAELALLLSSGMSLDRSISTVSHAASKEAHRAALAGLAGSVREGRTLAEAMRRQPEWFTAYQTGMVQAGEDAGRLPEVLRSLNAQEERAARVREQLASALTYPIILLFLGVLTVAAIVSFVIPRFSKVFEDMNIELPLFSAVVIAGANAAGTWAPALLVLGLAGFFIARARLRDEAQRAAVERWALERTRLGPIWWKNQSAVFCGAMAMMLKSGAPILRALETSRSAWTSVELRSRLDRVIALMREGSRLSDAAREARVLPAGADKLLAVGEEGGNLPEVLERIADSFETDVQSRVRRALTVLEPMAILVIGSVVGVVVVAMLLAIFSINDVQVM